MMWYYLDILMHNPDIQKTGFVLVVNASGRSVKHYQPKFASQGAINYRIFPMQLKMVHMCYCSLAFPLLAKAIKAVLSLVQRNTFLLHHGSGEKVLESLSEYDLPRHCLPTTMGECWNTLSKSDYFTQEYS